MKGFHVEMVGEEMKEGRVRAQGKVSGGGRGPRLRVLTSVVRARAPLQLSMTTIVLFPRTKGEGVGRQRK